jgi:hypothetical protein
MSILTDEIEYALEQVVSNREYYYSSRKSAKKWIIQDFADWLVKKFEEERYHGK